MVSARASDSDSGPDRQLDDAMERYVDGEAIAFQELYAGVADRVLGYLVKLVRDRSRAEDLLQVTFMRVHAARSAWARGARALPWIIAIARNAAFDELRARSRARVRLTATGIVPDYAAPVAEDSVDAAVSESLGAAIDGLPDSYREAIHLTKQLDLSIREAANIAGTTETAMKLRVHRAYRKLRHELAHLAPKEKPA